MPDGSILDSIGIDPTDGQLPQDGIENLQANFSPTIGLENLLPPADSPQLLSLPPMDDTAGLFENMQTPAFENQVASDLNNNAFGGSPDIGFDIGSALSGLAGSAFGAFVTTPQNAQTQENQALANAQIQSALTGQVFQYIFIFGLVFLGFSLFKRE